MSDLLLPERRAVFDSSIDDGLIPSPPPDAFGITEPGHVAWAAERLTPQRLRARTEPLEATPSLLATDLRRTPGPLVTSLEGSAARFGGDVVGVGVHTGHDAMIAQPADLAALDARE